MIDQTKIGRFIAAKRKEKSLTQAEVAKSLGITDRAVSKWERGLALPDASIMLNLCSILGISREKRQWKRIIRINRRNSFLR